MKKNRGNPGGRTEMNVFAKMGLMMMAFGLFIGIIFPYFCIGMGMSFDDVMRPVFLVSCVAAGIIVGAANVLITKFVVGRRLQLLNLIAENMESVREIVNSGDANSLREYKDVYLLPVRSDDEFGKSAESFNALVTSLSEIMTFESMIRRFNSTIVSSLDLDHMAQAAAEQLAAFSSSRAAAIALEGESGTRTAHSAGFDDELLSAADRYIRKVMASKRHTIADISGEAAPDKPGWLLVWPLKYKNTVTGAILLASDEPFSEQLLGFLPLFADPLAVAINNAANFSEMLFLAANDPLTGFYNRRFGLERLHQEFARAARNKSKLGLLMMDIDDFKQVNDTYSHQAGDTVLSEVSRVLRGIMREGDFLIRYGGEEFLAVLPLAGREVLSVVGERLRHLVENKEIDTGKIILRVTVSIGGTSFPEVHAGSESEMIAAADEMMYKAKNTGKNRVCIAEASE